MLDTMRRFAARTRAARNRRRSTGPVLAALAVFVVGAGGGGHALAELGVVLGVALPTVPGPPAAYAALIAVGLLVAARGSVHGAAMAWARSRSQVAS